MTLHWNSGSEGEPIPEHLASLLAEAFTGGDTEALDGLELTRHDYDRVTTGAREGLELETRLWVEAAVYERLVEAWSTGRPVTLREDER